MSNDQPGDLKQQEEESLPPAVRAFLRDVVQGSLMRFDVLRFFYNNPYAILTISDLSIWMSREEKPLADALQRLAALGYLTQSHASSAFVLTPEREQRRRVEECFAFLEGNPDLAKQIRARLRRQEEAE